MGLKLIRPADLWISLSLFLLLCLISESLSLSKNSYLCRQLNWIDSSRGSRDSRLETQESLCLPLSSLSSSTPSLSLSQHILCLRFWAVLVALSFYLIIIISSLTVSELRPSSFTYTRILFLEYIRQSGFTDAHKKRVTYSANHFADILSVGLTCTEGIREIFYCVKINYK